MRTYDIAPLYRSAIGFDRLLDMFESPDSMTSANDWPPYNVEKTGEDQYRISMAVAGFKPEDIELVQQQDVLIVFANKRPEPGGVQYLHRGIAARAFKQTFTLIDHLKVVDASLNNGLLTVELKRDVPEALKPRRIEIVSAAGDAMAGAAGRPAQIEHEPAKQAA
ncbi:Hsp20 family protein [Methylorubrum extorquens]|nr:Hsp20 family protein [Methylorubrum extorquens]